MGHSTEGGLGQALRVAVGRALITAHTAPSLVGFFIRLASVVPILPSCRCPQRVRAGADAVVVMSLSKPGQRSRCTSHHQDP